MKSWSKIQFEFLEVSDVVYNFLMLYKKFKLLSWNVRGLGGDEKCNIVRNIIKNGRCDVIVFQETKCNAIDLTYILRFLPSFFSLETVYNLALNSAGGTLIAWKKSFQLMKSWSTRHSVTVQLLHVPSGNML